MKDDLLAAELKLQAALKLPPPYSHREKPQWTRNDVVELLKTIRMELDQIAPFLAVNR